MREFVERKKILMLVKLINPKIRQSKRTYSYPYHHRQSTSFRFPQFRPNRLNLVYSSGQHSSYHLRDP